jgi:replication factor A1
MTSILTEGICQKLNSADKDDQSIWSLKPTLQFLSIKKVVPQNNPTSTGNSTADRYRIIISDGQHFVQAMLATQLNYLVEEDRVGKNTIVLIENMSCQHILDKRFVSCLLSLSQCAYDDIRLVIILGLRVLQRDSPKIGSPAPLTGPPQTKTDDVPLPSTTAPVPSTSAPPTQNRQTGNRTNPVYPIVALTPYQNNWRIKARVVQKSDVRHYSNQRGEGRLFSVTLMDDSGEIKGTAWNAMVDDLYEKLQENRVYFISKARINLAKKKFSTVSNDYELSLDRGIEIEEVGSSPHSSRLTAKSNVVSRCRCSCHTLQFRQPLGPTGSPK